MDISYRFEEVSITNSVFLAEKDNIKTQMSLKNKRHQFKKNGLLHQVSQAWHFAIGFEWLSLIVSKV